MNEIEAESDQAITEIERLEAEMGQIDELLEFISEVAEQTNMLALNANIEASRSSSTDDGFAVVADEVKELANETKLAAERIEERLDRIQAQTERTAVITRPTRRGRTRTLATSSPLPTSKQPVSTGSRDSETAFSSIRTDPSNRWGGVTTANSSSRFDRSLGRPRSSPADKSGAGRSGRKTWI